MEYNATHRSLLIRCMSIECSACDKSSSLLNCFHFAGIHKKALKTIALLMCIVHKIISSRMIDFVALSFDGAMALRVLQRAIVEEFSERFIKCDFSNLIEEKQTKLLQKMFQFIKYN